MENELLDLPLWMTKKPVINKTKEFIQFKGQIKQCLYPNMLASCAEEILTKIESNKIHKVVYGFDMEWPVTYDGKPKKNCSYTNLH
ncbi:Werner Syndrome-like exonuclease isoform X1 [Aphis craccivora]|uniref:Werner Syndrome-like exonuclease isoform X1 n=1 Tax=Aphis craccivora TaxID=307492 RepID=A0A6G0YSC5_APHCR|nr:Werner Syndrome-like exonuclease isoform X1 [Aphis craccivora]